MSLGFLLLFAAILCPIQCQLLPVCTKGPLVCALHIFSDIGTIQFRFHLDIINFWDKHVTGREEYVQDKQVEEIQSQIQDLVNDYEHVDQQLEMKKQLHKVQDEYLDAKIQFWRGALADEINQDHEKWLENYENNIRKSLFWAKLTRFMFILSSKHVNFLFGSFSLHELLVKS